METIIERDYMTSRLKVERANDGTFNASWRNPLYGGYWAQTKRGGFGFSTAEEAEQACIETIEECCGEPRTHQGRPLQYMLSNGDWVDVLGTGDSYIARAIEHYKGRFTHDQILAELRAGKFARTGTDWYDKIRFAPKVELEPEPEMVLCDCGHRCERALRMSASLGSSCPDCYDRMSDVYERETPHGASGG